MLPKLRLRHKKPHIPDFRKVAHVIVDTAMEIADKHVRQFAEDEKRAFVERIERQDFESFSAFPLSRAYLARKIAAGADERTMIATRWYIDHIRVWSRKDRKKRSTTLRIGFHPFVRARDLQGKITDILLSDVARIQEHGSVRANIPPRPHWRPNLEDMRERAVELRGRIKTAIMAAVHGELS